RDVATIRLRSLWLCSRSLLPVPATMRRPRLRASPFAFNSLRPPRHLHSFPTRRSSDLDSTTPWTSRRRGVAGLHLTRLVLDDGRSEEHTSELQSRFDLVCRLLLEKKKRIQPNARYSAKKRARSYTASRTDSNTVTLEGE